jgi:hypothetical protein
MDRQRIIPWNERRTTNGDDLDTGLRETAWPVMMMQAAAISQQDDLL